MLNSNMADPLDLSKYAESAELDELLELYTNYT